MQHQILDDADQTVFNDEDVLLLNNIYKSFRLGSILTYCIMIFMCCSCLALLALCINAYPTAKRNVHMIAGAEKPLARVEFVVGAASNAAITLFSGNLAHLLARIAEQPWKMIATSVANICTKLTGAFSPFAMVDFMAGITTGVSVVGSVANQISQTVTNFGDADANTGEWGLLLGPVDYAADWVVNQTQPVSWQFVGKQCQVMTSKLLTVNWYNTYHCPSPGYINQMCDWDGTDSVVEQLTNVQLVCIALSIIDT